MKIIVVGIRGIPDIPGGIENHCAHLYPLLVQLGCEVTVLGRQPYVGKKRYTYKGVKVIPLPCPKNKFLEALIHTALGSLLARFFNPDIVHFHAVGPSFFLPVTKLLGCTVVATHHGFDYDRDKWDFLAKEFIKRGERHLCKAHAVISISRHISDFLYNRFKCESHLIPNGVEINPAPVQASEYLHKWNVKKGMYFFFAGRFVPEKCIDDLLYAFRNLKTSWKIVIAGDSDHEDSYSRKIKKEGKCIPNVILTGYVKGDELKSLFSGAGAFILPSTHEGLPIALLEALSYGLPCIASDIPANKAVNHPSIQYFKVHDIDTLSGLMTSMTKKKASHNNREIKAFIRENYDWKAIAENTFNLYRVLLAQKASLQQHHSA